MSELQRLLVQVHIITASCENMIDGKGMRPGDILQAANGKTVEVCVSHDAPVLPLPACEDAVLYNNSSTRVLPRCHLRF